MRYSGSYDTGDIKSGLLFIIGGILLVIILLIPVKQWWIFGIDNVPEILENATLITSIYELWPVILIFAGIFLFLLAFGKMGKRI